MEDGNISFSLSADGFRVFLSSKEGGNLSPVADTKDAVIMSITRADLEKLYKSIGTLLESDAQQSLPAIACSA